MIVFLEYSFIRSTSFSVSQPLPITVYECTTAKALTEILVETENNDAEPGEKQATVVPPR